MPHRTPPFRRAWWARGAHLQTIGGRLLRRARPEGLARERLETPDGDFVDLDFAPFLDDATAPLVLLLHGLEGSARRGYAMNVYRALARHGVAAVGLNFRSCSGEPNRTARFYHSGDTDDIRFVLDQLARRFRGRAVGAIGFSLGGNALLKYLGEEGERSRVRVAVAVSVPYDLAEGARLLDGTRMGRFYVKHFLKTLRGKAEAKRALLEGRVDFGRLSAARSFVDFDDLVTAPLHGFRDAADYYRRSSSAQFLERIRVPTLLIHAEDDPFLPARAIPRPAIDANPFLHALITQHGGHVGFIGGLPWAPTFWAEEAAAEFLAGKLRGGSGSTPRPPRSTGR
jgi:predicted alpha/beta-fold hydrolase